MAPEPAQPAYPETVPHEAPPFEENLHVVGRNSQYTRRLPSDDIRLAPQAALMGELDDENAPPALVLRKSDPL
jgi:hypothetical protein